MIPTIEDKHQYTTTGHIVTNEEATVWTGLLEDLPEVDRIGTIASGGEIVLKSFLIKAKEVVAIDHSYRALCAFYTKMLLIDSLGKEAKKVLSLPPGEFIREIEKDVFKRIPSAILKDNTPSKVFTGWDHQNIQKEWQSLEDDVYELIANRLDRLKVIHGDLTDLTGPLDVLYISNAMEHTTRDNYQHPDLLKVIEPLKVGGRLLRSSSQGFRQPPGHETLKVLKTVAGPVHSPWTTSWNYISAERLN